MKRAHRLVGWFCLSLVAAAVMFEVFSTGDALLYLAGLGIGVANLLVGASDD